MAKPNPRTLIAVLAACIPLAFSLGIHWALGTTRVTPALEAVRAVRDCIAEHYDEHGSFPASLDILPHQLKGFVSEYHITYDREKLELRSKTDPYYDYSFRYILTRGVLGTRVLTGNPGFDLSVIRD